jgi:hypothetical protein
MTISDNSRNYRKFAEKGIPGLFPEVATALEVVHQCRSEVL